MTLATTPLSMPPTAAGLSDHHRTFLSLRQRHGRMAVATDTFVARFGDRSFLEFELAIDSIRYENGEAVVAYSVEKVNQALGGITWEIVLNGPRGTATTARTTTGSGGSGTLRIPAEVGDTVDLILYDTRNTDHEPGDGLDGGGEAQVNATVPQPEPDASLVTISSCSSGGSVAVGENATVDVVVRNENPVSAPATVTVTAADATAEQQVSVPAQGEQQVSVTFTFDSPGDYEPSVEVGL